MKGKRHATEAKPRILRKADTGTSVQAICREHQISEQTFYGWKKEFGMLEVNQAKRLKELEKENARLRAECLEREQLWTLSEARVVTEDWRHRSLGYQTPKSFAGTASQAAASGRATPSLRPQLDVASLLERYFNPQPNCSRLTLSVGQFG